MTTDLVTQLGTLKRREAPVIGPARRQAARPLNLDGLPQVGAALQPGHRGLTRFHGGPSLGCDEASGKIQR